MSQADEIPPPPAELKGRALAHMSERMLAMGEELRAMALDVGAYGGTVDRHDSEIADLKRRLRVLEQRVETGEHPTLPGE